MHYYKFNIAGWTLSTAHLSLTEEAIYFRLINYYYDTEKPIPVETHSVFRRLRMASESDTANSILEEFFTLTEKGWIQSRCEENIKEYKKTAKKNKLNGSKGGRPSKAKAYSVTQNKPTGLDSVSQNNPNYKLRTNNQELRTKENKKTKRFSPPTEQELTDFMISVNWPADNGATARAMIDYYAQQGWKLSNGNMMKDWEASARGWLRNQQKWDAKK